MRPSVRIDRAHPGRAHHEFQPALFHGEGLSHRMVVGRVETHAHHPRRLPGSVDEDTPGVEEDTAHARPLDRIQRVVRAALDRLTVERFGDPRSLDLLGMLLPAGELGEAFAVDLLALEAEIALPCPVHLKEAALGVAQRDGDRQGLEQLVGELHLIRGESGLLGQRALLGLGDAGEDVREDDRQDHRRRHARGQGCPDLPIGERCRDQHEARVEQVGETPHQDEVEHQHRGIRPEDAGDAEHEN